MTNHFTINNGRSRALAIAAALVVAVLALSACNPEGTPRQRAAGNCVVGVVGDSLTVGARDYGGLAAKFAARGCTVTAIDARVGRPTVEGAGVVEAWARNGTLPAILVVALGTNDCNPAVFEPAARRIIAAAGGRPVLWVNTWRARCDGAINGVINSIQLGMNVHPDKGNVWILDHWSWIHANRGMLGRDGLHLSRGGYEAHADRIVASVTG
jgi:hypothetical protein